MGQKYQYTTVDRIFTKLIREGTSTFSEDDVIEWIGEALEFIGAAPYYEEAVAFVEVKNHQCDVPKGLHAIVQIAKDNRWREDPYCPAKAIIASKTETQISIPVVLDCNGQPLSEYDLAYYRPYFDLKAETLGWCFSDGFRRRFTPIRLSTSSLFGKLVCETNEKLHAVDCKDSYQVIQRKTLRFSFERGGVLIAYTRQVRDVNTGYPLIPDNISYTTAIVRYLDYMIARRDYKNNREGAKGQLDTFERDWQWYCKQATNVDLMPNGIDEHQNLLDQRSYLLPRKPYYGFFGNLNTPENRVWNKI